MTLYETLFVVHPERGSRNKEFIERFKKVIEGQEGTVSLVDEWGMRDLAYRIEKQSKGFYTLLRSNEELERNLKLTDGILRYLTVRTEENAITNPFAARPHTDQPRSASEENVAKTEPSV